MSVDDRFKAMFAELSDIRAQVREREERLNGGDGGGTSGEMTGDWKENVDRQLGQLHGDVRSLLYAGVAAVVALAALIGGLYLHMDAKFERIDGKFERVDAKFNAMNDRLTQILVEQQKTNDLLDRREVRRDAQAR